MPISLQDGAGSGFFARVTDEGRLLVDISGAIINIGSVSANVDSIFVQSGANLTGSFYQAEGIPTSSIYLNPNIVLVYSGTAIGSIYKNTSTGSYLKILSYDGSDKLTGVSAWTVV